MRRQCTARSSTSARVYTVCGGAAPARSCCCGGRSVTRGQMRLMRRGSRRFRVTFTPIMRRAFGSFRSNRLTLGTRRSASESSRTLMARIAERSTSSSLSRSSATMKRPGSARAMTAFNKAVRMAGACSSTSGRTMREASSGVFTPAVSDGAAHRTCACRDADCTYAAIDTSRRVHRTCPADTSWQVPRGH